MLIHNVRDSPYQYHFYKNTITAPFGAIVGYKDIPSHEQKLHPSAGIKCLSDTSNNADQQLRAEVKNVMCT